MARTNVKVKSDPVYTHEGAKALKITPLQQFRRSILSCMLWEQEHYEDGETIADRIIALIPKIKSEDLFHIAVEARTQQHLRHVPFLVAKEMAASPKHKHLVSTLLPQIILRADELAEFMAMYWEKKRLPISHQIRKGLAESFKKFDEYQLAKYNRDAKVKLSDVLRMIRPKPDNKKQAQLWGKLRHDQLEVPRTWETVISATKGEGKKSAWESLLKDNSLGGLALLRNLRNLNEVGIDKTLVKKMLSKANFNRVLPFRFIAAANAVPYWEDIIEPVFLDTVSKQVKLPGKTVLVVDVSGSMYSIGNISKHSDMTRVHAAAALAAIIREVCEEAIIYATAGSDHQMTHATQIIPTSRRGFALTSMISDSNQLCHKLGGGGIFLTQCMDYIHDKENKADRIIVITDEQDCDVKCNPDKANAFGNENYLINIASNKNGIGYGKWVHIDGWSEAVINFIKEYETDWTD